MNWRWAWYAQQQAAAAARQRALNSQRQALQALVNQIPGRNDAKWTQARVAVCSARYGTTCHSRSPGWQPVSNEMVQITSALRSGQIGAIQRAITVARSWIDILNKAKAKKAAESKAAEAKAAAAKAAAAKAAASKSAADKAAAAKKAADAKAAAVKASQAAAAKGDTAEAAKQMTLAQKIAALEAKIRGFETKEAERRGYERARKEFRERRRRWKRRRKGTPSAPTPVKASAAVKKTAVPTPAKPKAVVCKGGLRKRGDKCVPPPRPRWRCPRGKKPNFPSNWYDPAARKRYVAKYKDVAAAVRGGSIRSGLYHYACTGSREGRSWSGYSRPGYIAGIFANWDQEV